MPPKSRESRQNDLRKTTRYRSKATGRYQSAARGARKETWLVGRGEQLREISEAGLELRTAVPMREGRMQGHLGMALDVSGIAKKAKVGKTLTLTATGKDYRDKTRRVKIQIHIKTEKHLKALMVGRLQEELYRRGYRPQYKLEVVPWADRKVTKSLSRGKKQLRNMRIIATVTE